MNDAQANPTQGQQNAASSRSPSKEPAHETALADAENMARDFASHPGAGAPADPAVERNPDPLPDVDPGLESKPHPDPLVVARSRIVSVDTHGTAASDGTVDTDGKAREARRHQGLRRDNQVHSNAVLDDHVPTPPDGLGGIDSRAGGNLVRLALAPGWRVVDLGPTVHEGLNGSRGARRFRLEHHDASDDASSDSTGDAIASQDPASAHEG